VWHTDCVPKDDLRKNLHSSPSVNIFKERLEKHWKDYCFSWSRRFCSKMTSDQPKGLPGLMSRAEEKGKGNKRCTKPRSTKLTVQSRSRPIRTRSLPQKRLRLNTPAKIAQTSAIFSPCRLGSCRIESIDPLRFLAGWCKRRLNQFLVAFGLV